MPQLGVAVVRCCHLEGVRVEDPRREPHGEGDEQHLVTGRVRARVRVRRSGRVRFRGRGRGRGGAIVRVRGRGRSTGHVLARSGAKEKAAVKCRPPEEVKA